MTTMRSRLHRSLGLGALLLCAPACEKKNAEEGNKGAPQKEGSSAARIDQRPPAISVVSATYGHSCGAAMGNHTAWVKAECGGKVACAFKVSNEHGDPSPECAKDFSVEYRCGERADTRKAEHPAEAGENYSVQLSCQ